MKKQLNIPNLAVLMIMVASVAGPEVFAASNIKITDPHPLFGKTGVYERVLNPYINIKTDQRSVGNTYTVRNGNGKIIRTGVITAEKICHVPTGKLVAGVYTIHIGGNLLQEFTVI